MDINKIPRHVLIDVRQRGFSHSEIERMPAEQLFDEYLSWNGIIGYGFDFYHIALQLDKLESEQKGE